MESNIQRRHRAPPQHNLPGKQGADGIEEGVGKTIEPKVKGSCRQEQKQLLGQDPEQEPNPEQEAGTEDRP